MKLLKALKNLLREYIIKCKMEREKSLIEGGAVYVKRKKGEV